jgi:hypothetical protein
MMKNNPGNSTTFLPVMITSVVLNAIGWIGLILLVLFTLPTLFPRWLFFFLLTIAFSGVALPFIYLLHRRFSNAVPLEVVVMMREALWVGIFIDLLAWLQLGRMLTPVRGFLIAAGMTAIEYFLRLRERSKFKPRDPETNG